MTPITLHDYFGRHPAGSEVSADRLAAAERLLGRVNALLEAAEAAGVHLRTNPVTRSHISGSGGGGFRHAASTVGATGSRHRRARAVDVFDPRRELAQWLIEYPAALIDHDLYMEDPRWTPTWVHLQDERPGSGSLVFRPSMAPPAAPPLDGQTGLA